MSPCVSQSPRSDARCCDAGSGVVSPACLPVCQMPDTVTLAPGSSPACLPVSPSLSDARCCLPVSACLPVSPSLRGQMPPRVSQSAAGRCDAGVVSPACLPVSPSLRSQIWQMLRRWLRGRVSRLFACLRESPRSDARCCDFCDAGFGVVSPACLPVSPSLRGDAGSPASLCLSVSVQMPDAWLQGRVSQSLRSDARRCKAGSGRVSRLSPCVWTPDAVTLALPVASCPVSRLTLLGIQFGSVRLPSAHVAAARKRN